MALSVLAAACSLELTQPIAATELETSERGGFTPDGKFYAIGTKPMGRADSGSWVVNVTRDESGRYVANDFVAGAFEGTDDGTLRGKPKGEPCVFSGMAVHGFKLYAACATLEFHASLLEIDTQAGTVRAAAFTSCNAEPAKLPCEPLMFYPNGMSVDAAGRVYLSNTAAHLSFENPDLPAISVEGSRSITQVRIDAAASSAGQLAFTHHDWYSTDILTDGLTPNGIQIEGDTLYYAAGPNINRVAIREDGSAGTFGVHYYGPALSYIDDFAVRDGRMALARTLPPAIVALERAPRFGNPRELGSYAMDLTRIPSSISIQDDIPLGMSLFPSGSLVITCYFGGGLWVLAEDP
ncbi:MAG TPA: hypothetical protein VJR89_42235 [Polyangiales bacterium]|nr:hypothetical protein [Polyangiales bacterium]